MKLKSKIELDRWQQEVLDTKGNLAIRSGRQTGKSTVISVLASEFAVKNKQKIVMVIAASERQAYLLYEKIYDYILKYYKSYIKSGKQYQTKTKLELKNNTRIYCLPTGLDGRTIRGYTVDLLIADEAAFIPRAVFDALTPAISTRYRLGARIILSSTPFGRDNYFYECFQNNSFTTFHVSSEECPRIDKDFLAQEKLRMSKMSYAQEYLGEFASEQMQVFPDKLIRARQTLKREKINKDANYYLGADIARLGDDKTALQIIEEKDGVLYHRENITTEKTRLDETYKLILELDRKYNFEKIFIDNEGIGVGVYDFLKGNEDTKSRTYGVLNSLEIRQEDGKVKYQKEELYTLFLSLMRQKLIYLLDDEDVFMSLRAIRFEYTNDGLGRSHLKIGATRHTDTDIPEGLIRAALAFKYKDLNVSVYTINI